jgi:hypothetical protein
VALRATGFEQRGDTHFARAMPIFENALLFATTTSPTEHLEVRPDGTVAPASPRIRL